MSALPFYGCVRSPVRRRAAAHEDLEAHPRNPDDAGGPSAVVVPADGRVPMQAWADAQRPENAKKYLHHNAAGLLSGVPVTMYMTGLYQFEQTPEYFVIQSEEAHPWRSIPLDGRPRHHAVAGRFARPAVFTRPWKMSMPLYRRQEKNLQLLEYECYAYRATR